MITELNPIYEEAWKAQEGSGSFYYRNPDEVEQTGETLDFPALFRILRTNDTLKSTTVNDRYERSETFVACLQMSDFPGMDEEIRENRLLGLVQGFLRTLREDGQLSFNVPTNYRWYRRDVQDFCLCLAFDIAVTVNAEDWQCL